MQVAPLGSRAHDIGNVVDARGRKQQAPWRGRQSGRIAYRRALDGRFRTIEEGIEHLRIEPAGLEMLMQVNEIKQ